MTGLDHEHSAAIEEAARWLALTTRERIGRPIVPALRQQFGLSPVEACAAIKEAQEMRDRGGANADAS